MFFFFLSKLVNKFGCYSNVKGNFLRKKNSNVFFSEAVMGMILHYNKQYCI